MVDMSLRAAIALDSEEFTWHRARPLIMRLSTTQNHPSLDLLIILASPHVSWYKEPYNKNMVARWAAAASALPYREDVSRSVVDTLLHIASVNTLRSHIPVCIWAWLKEWPSLPPECPGRSRGSSRGVVRRVRAIGDTEALESYLLLVWSEWDHIDDQQSGGLAEMGASIRAEFGGIAMWRHRQDLIKRLDHVLGQLDGGFDHLQQHKPSLDTHHTSRAKTQYSELKAVVLDVDVEAMNTLARKPPRSIFFGLLTPTDTYRIPLDFRMCPASTVPVICLEHLPLFRPTTWFAHRFLPCRYVFSTLLVVCERSRYA